MLDFIKYLPALLRLKDVSSVYKEEKGKEKPIFVSQRFVGVVLGTIAFLLGIGFDIAIDPKVVTAILDNFLTIANIINDNSKEIISSVGIVYASIMTIKGQINASKRKSNTKIDNEIK